MIIITGSGGAFAATEFIQTKFLENTVETIIRAVIGLVLVVGAIVFMIMDPQSIYVWILGGAAIAIGVVVALPIFRKKNPETTSP